MTTFYLFDLFSSFFKINIDEGQEEDFFDLLWRYQSKRMDDHRCDPRTLAEAAKSGRPRVRATDGYRGEYEE